MKKRYLVVGSGVSGLTYADCLTKEGHDVTILEKEDHYGGLATSHNREGFVFDSGPHWIFFQPGSPMEKYITELLGSDIYSVVLNPGVYFLGKYYPWPLSLKVIFQLPFPVMVGAFLDIFKVAFKKKAPIHNYEDFMLQKFGKTLYDLDFEPYTRKFTKTPLTELHVDWSKIGVNRSVEDKPELSSIFSVIKQTLSPKKKKIGYYLHQGIQGLPDAQWARIEKQGGKMLLSTAVEDIKVENGSIRKVKFSDGSWHEFDHVVWSGDPEPITQMVLGRTYDLKFLTNVFYYVLVKGHSPQPYQWLYYVDDDILFNRLYNNTLFSEKHAPAGHYGYCAEVTCRPGSDIEQNPEKYIEDVKSSLVKTRAVCDTSDILEIYPLKKKQAYPLYSLDYRARLSDCISNLYATCDNLTMAGRTGLFWYNNMDHSIENALGEMPLLLTGQRNPFKVAK